MRFVQKMLGWTAASTTDISQSALFLLRMQRGGHNDSSALRCPGFAVVLVAPELLWPRPSLFLCGPGGPGSGGLADSPWHVNACFVQKTSLRAGCIGAGTLGSRSCMEVLPVSAASDALLTLLQTGMDCPPFPCLWPCCMNLTVFVSLFVSLCCLTHNSPVRACFLKRSFSP